MAKSTTTTAAKPKHKLTAADRKKGQLKRAQICESARNLALQDNDNAKTVTKTIKVRNVVATKGKLKKSMAAYRKDAECTLNGTCGKKPKAKTTDKKAK